jgi:hypothetical protein
VEWLSDLDSLSEADRTRKNIDDDYLQVTADLVAEIQARTCGASFNEWTRLRKLHLQLAETHSWTIAAAIMKEQELLLQSDSPTAAEVLNFVANYRKAMPAQPKNQGRRRRGGAKPRGPSTAKTQQTKTQASSTSSASTGTNPMTPAPTEKERRTRSGAARTIKT